VARYDGEHKVKSFSCLDQYLCMAFAQLTYRESLRDIEACLRAQESKLYHMGIHSRVSRSTLADANESRDWRIYADLAQSLIRIARTLYADEPFGVDLKETVYALDASTIDLCLSVFPWAPFRSAIWDSLPARRPWHRRASSNFHFSLPDRIALISALAPVRPPTAMKSASTPFVFPCNPKNGGRPWETPADGQPNMRRPRTRWYSANTACFAYGPRSISVAFSSALISPPTAIRPLSTSTTAFTKSPNCPPAISFSLLRAIAVWMISIPYRTRSYGFHAMVPDYIG